MQYTIHQFPTTNDGNIGPDTLETENQQEPEPEQEAQYTIHQLPTMNDPDNFGFGDISPNTLEAEHQQEQEQNTSSHTTKYCCNPS